LAHGDGTGEAVRSKRDSCSTPARPSRISARSFTGPEAYAFRGRALFFAAQYLSRCIRSRSLSAKTLTSSSSDFFACSKAVSSPRRRAAASPKRREAPTGLLMSPRTFSAVPSNTVMSASREFGNPLTPGSLAAPALSSISGARATNCTACQRTSASESLTRAKALALLQETFPCGARRETRGA
jgi:hypothetical protein